MKGWLIKPFTSTHLCCYHEALPLYGVRVAGQKEGREGQNHHVQTTLPLQDPGGDQISLSSMCPFYPMSMILIAGTTYVWSTWRRSLHPSFLHEGCWPSPGTVTWIRLDHQAQRNSSHVLNTGSGVSNSFSLWATSAECNFRTVYM